MMGPPAAAVGITVLTKQWATGPNMFIVEAENGCCSWCPFPLSSTLMTSLCSLRTCAESYMPRWRWWMRSDTILRLNASTTRGR